MVSYPMLFRVFSLCVALLYLRTHPVLSLIHAGLLETWKNSVSDLQKQLQKFCKQEIEKVSKGGRKDSSH